MGTLLYYCYFENTFLLFLPPHPSIYFSFFFYLSFLLKIYQSFSLYYSQIFIWPQDFIQAFLEFAKEKYLKKIKHSHINNEFWERFLK